MMQPETYNAAQARQNAINVRSRLMGKAPVKNVLYRPPKPPVAIDPPKTAPKAISIKDYDFNWHMSDYFQHKLTLSKQAGESEYSEPVEVIVPPKMPAIKFCVIWLKKNEPLYNMEMVRSCSRNRELVKVRHALIVAVYNEYSLTFPQMGRLFNRDHTTIMHACRALPRRVIK